MKTVLAGILIAAACVLGGILLAACAPNPRKQMQDGIRGVEIACATKGPHTPYEAKVCALVAK